MVMRVKRHSPRPTISSLHWNLKNVPPGTVNFPAISGAGERGLQGWEEYVFLKKAGLWDIFFRRNRLHQCIIFSSSVRQLCSIFFYAAFNSHRGGDISGLFLQFLFW